LPLLVNGEAREAMKTELAHVCTQLGKPGASHRTADLALQMLSKRKTADA